MSDEFASSTAVLAVCCRDYFYRADPDPIFADALAGLFVTERHRESVRNRYARDLRIMNPHAARGVSDPGLLADMAIRASWSASVFMVRPRYMEDALDLAVARGIRQYVLIAAGFDTFVLRRWDLRKQLQVFEVDHPNTQRLKLVRLARQGLAIPGNMRAVPCDVVRDDLQVRLTAAGFRADEPSFFAIPGLIMYLSPHSFAALLTQMNALAAPGSELTLDYLEAGALGPVFPSLRLELAVRGAAYLKERMQSSFSATEMASLCDTHGWHVVEDIGKDEMGTCYYDASLRLRPPECLRLLRASVTDSPL